MAFCLYIYNFVVSYVVIINEIVHTCVRMSFNNRADLILREHLESRGAPTPSGINKSHGVNRVDFPEESIWKPWKLNVPTPSGSASLDETNRRLEIAGEYPFVPGGSRKVEYTKTSAQVEVSEGPIIMPVSPVEKVFETCQDSTSSSAFPVNVSDSQCEQSKIVKDTVFSNGVKISNYPLWNPDASPCDMYVSDNRQDSTSSGALVVKASDSQSEQSKIVKYTVFSNGVKINNNSPRNPAASPCDVYVSDNQVLTPLPTPSGSARKECRHISVVDGSSKKVVDEPLTLKSIHLNRGPASPLEKAVSTCQVPIMSEENAAASATVVNTNHVPRTEQSKIVKVYVTDKESDKRDLISAMQSVMTTLKVREAKKQEDSIFKAQAACGLDDAAENRLRQLGKVFLTHLKLAEAAKKNKANLTDKASDIQTRLLLLLRDEEEMFSVLDDMHGNLKWQLAQVEQEIKMAKLVNLQRQKAHEHLSHEECNVKMVTERTRALKVEAKNNKELRELLEDYREEVDILEQDLKTMREEIMQVKKDFEQHTCMVKCDTTSKTGVGVDSSISSRESAGLTRSEILDQLRMSIARRSAALSLISSEDTEGSKLSDSSDSEASETVQASNAHASDSVGLIFESESEASEETEDSASDSEDSTSESDTSEESEDSESESATYEETEDSTSESDTSDESEDSESVSEESEESEDSADESEASEESEDSSSESEASEESDDSGHAKPSDLEVSVAFTSQNVTALSLADPSETDSSQNTITDTEYHELPHETNVIEATNATNEAKIISDDDWDFCDNSDSNA